MLDGYKLIWTDEFEQDGAPDPRRWHCDVGAGGFGNNELQHYTARPENVYVRDGVLHLTALREDFGNERYTSAKLTTFGLQSWTYGRFVIRAKLPRGKGSWPAIWMLPDDIQAGKPWPLCGEIDIMEHVGWNENMIHVSLHSEKYNHVRNTQRTHFEPLEEVWNRFHDYEMEWTPGAIEFFFDGRSVARFEQGEGGSDPGEEGWPFDKPYFLILNIAVGGNWGGEVDETAMPYQMEIASVRVYQKE